MRSPVVLVLVFLLLAVQFAVSQDTQTQRQMKDVLYLKNGSVIKGTILELQPEKSVRIRTSDGSVFVFEMAQVEKIVKEEDTAPVKTTPLKLTTPTTPVAAEASRSTQFLINGGISLPVGPFSKTGDPEAGAAKSGYAVAAELVIPFGDAIHIEFAGQYGANGVNTDEIKSMIESSFPGITVAVDAKRWTCIYALGGIGFGTNSGTGTEFDVTPLIGVLFGSTPQITATVNYLGTSSTSTQESINGSGLAYGGSVRLILGYNFTIGARYLASKPKYESSTSIGGATSTSSFEQKTEMVVIYAGFAF